MRHLIARHQIIRLRFAPDQFVPPKPYWPRPAMALAFYPREPEHIMAVGETAFTRKPRAALIGQPTMLTSRQGGHDFSVYQIELRPGALYRLTGLPADRITNTCLDAEAVLPSGFRALVDAIEDTDDPDTMIALAEAWLLALPSASCYRQSSAHDWAADQLLRGSCASLDTLAGATGTDIRQLRRLFTTRSGTSPRMFARIARFDRAVRLHNHHPADDWLSVAVDAGYYDHQHLARDFRDFTAMSPTQFALLEGRAPERTFGQYEH